LREEIEWEKGGVPLPIRVLKSRDIGWQSLPADSQSQQHKRSSLLSLLKFGVLAQCPFQK
jgi:hypothetical protein